MGYPHVPRVDSVATPRGCLFLSVALAAAKDSKGWRQVDEPRHVGAPAPAEPKVPREAETPTPAPDEGASCTTPPPPQDDATLQPAADLTAADPTGAIEEQPATLPPEAPHSPEADTPVSREADSVTDCAAEPAGVSAAEVEAKGDHETEAPPAVVGVGRPAGPTSEPVAAAEPEPQVAAPPHPAEPEPDNTEAVTVADAEPQAVEATAVAEAEPQAAEAAEQVATVEPDLWMPEISHTAEPEPRRTGTGAAQDLRADLSSPPAGPAHVPAAPRAPGPAALSWGRSEASAAPTVQMQGPAARPVPAWMPPSLPSRETVGSYLRLAGHVAAAVVTGLFGIVLALVVLYRWVDPPASTLMVGQRLAGTSIERTWVPLVRISPHLVKAVILSEDGGFCRHRGVDWTALGQAMEDARGGSTITMQVVKNLFLWPSRSYVRKAIEIALASLVELIWPKRRILEIYLNIAEWGDGVFGAEAAARWHFGKSAAQLTAAEAALLAVALPNPTERTAGSPSPGMRRLATRLMVRMAASRASLACVRTGPRQPREAHLFPGRD
jgi:monofunctional biosynthetic peptidoglycan transglycosylase